MNLYPLPEEEPENAFAPQDEEAGKYVIAVVGGLPTPAILEALKSAHKKLELVVIESSEVELAGKVLQKEVAKPIAIKELDLVSSLSDVKPLTLPSILAPHRKRSRQNWGKYSHFFRK